LGTGNQPETSAISEPPTERNEMKLYTINHRYQTPIINGLNQVMLYTSEEQAMIGLKKFCSQDGSNYDERDFIIVEANIVS
jgi:hypothetical protein